MANPAVTRIVCLGCSESEDVEIYCCEELLCDRPANIWNLIYVNYSYPEM